MALELEKEEVTRRWRKLQYGEICNLLFSVAY